MFRIPIFEPYLSVENLKWFFKLKLKSKMFLLNWVPGILPPLTARLLLLLGRRLQLAEDDRSELLGGERRPPLHFHGCVGFDLEFDSFTKILSS